MRVQEDRSRVALVSLEPYIESCPLPCRGSRFVFSLLENKHSRGRSWLACSVHLLLIVVINVQLLLVIYKQSYIRIGFV